MPPKKKKATKKKSTRDSDKKRDEDDDHHDGNGTEDAFFDDEPKEQHLYDDKLFHDDELTRFQHSLRVMGTPWTHISQNELNEATGKRPLGLNGIVYEPALVEGHTLLLPTDALQDPSILQHIFSMETWNNVLTEHDKSFLKRYLPPSVTQSDKRLNSALEELFSRKNLHFGNDVDVLIHRLLAGYYHPLVAKQREYVQYLQRKEHQVDLQLYNYEFERNVYEQKLKRGMITEKPKVKPSVPKVVEVVNEEDSIFDDDDEPMEDDEDAQEARENLMIDE